MSSELTTELSSFIRRCPARKKEPFWRGSGPPKLPSINRRFKSGLVAAKALRASKTEFLASRARVPS